MPTYETVQFDGIMQTTVEGALDLTSTAAMLRGIAEENDAQSRHLLIDLRGAEASRLSYSDVYALAGVPGLDFGPMQTTYVLGRERVISTSQTSGMARWRERLFSVLSNNARSATSFFRIPPNRVVEMGAQVEI